MSTAARPGIYQYSCRYFKYIRETSGRRWFSHDSNSGIYCGINAWDIKQVTYDDCFYKQLYKHAPDCLFRMMIVFICYCVFN